MGYRVFGPIFANGHGANGAGVRGSYGLTMLRRAQFHSGGTGSAAWKGDERGVPSAHPHPAVGAAMQVIAMRRRVPGAGPRSARRRVACGRCRRRGVESPDVEQAGRSRPARRRDAASGPGIAGGVASAGIGPGAWAAWAGRSGCVVPAPAVRQAGGGRARASGTTGSGAQSIVVNRARGSSWRWRGSGNMKRDPRGHVKRAPLSTWETAIARRRSRGRDTVPVGPRSATCIWWRACRRRRLRGGCSWTSRRCDEPSVDRSRWRGCRRHGRGASTRGGIRSSGGCARSRG